VLGHADKKSKVKPLTITPIEKENIECNEEENARVEEGVIPMKFNP